MPEQLTKTKKNQLNDRWNALERQQKIKGIAVMSVVLLALMIAVYFTVRERYVYFVSGVKDGVQVMPLENVLRTAGIRYKLADNGTAFMVEERRLTDAKWQMAVNANMEGLSVGFTDALVTVEPVPITEPLKKQMLSKAKEIELAEIIATFDGVVSVNVNLMLPEIAPSERDLGDKPKASVRIVSSRDLSRREGLAMAHLVSRSVEGLALEDIAIYDTRYNTLYSGMQGTMGMDIGSNAEEVSKCRSN